MLDILLNLKRGKSLMRILMNKELKNYNLSGKVVDVGGGKDNSFYNLCKKLFW